MKTDSDQPVRGTTVTPDISAVSIRIYKPGQTIIREGDKNNWFYVIQEGTVEVSQKGKNVRILRDADVFGLETFFLFRPYTITVRALTTSRIATYSMKVLKDIIYTRPQLTERILDSILGQLEQTTQIAEENIVLGGVADINEKVYEDGEVVVEEGTIGDDFFRLLMTERGLLVTKEGKEIGKIDKPGELLGEMSSILKQPRPTTIASSGRSVIQVFPAGNLDEIIELYPEVAKKLLNDLAYQMIEANRQITEVSEEKKQDGLSN